MPPSGLPVKEDIIANLKTALETITAGDDYYTSVQRVTRYVGGPMDMTEFPSSSLGVDPDVPVELEKFIRDARQAVIVDRTRGSKAINTFAVSDQVFSPNQDDDPYAAAQLIIEINYRTNWDDLNIAT